MLKNLGLPTWSIGIFCFLHFAFVCLFDFFFCILKKISLNMLKCSLNHTAIKVLLEEFKYTISHYLEVPFFCFIKERLFSIFE